MKATGIQNTYFLVKNLTERMVMTYSGSPLRLCIVRPTIVTGRAARAVPRLRGQHVGHHRLLPGHGHRRAPVLPAHAGLLVFLGF